MKKFLIIGVAVMALGAQAVIYSTNWTGAFANNGVVPDNNYSGWANSQTWGGPAGPITAGSLLVSVELSGGWNGDLYAYLIHDTGFAVVLDRVGQGTGSEPTFTYGYGTAGMNVWLTDGAGLGNIDGVSNPVSGGTYSRNGYAGSLGTFDGLNSSGAWTLFIADLSAGGVTTVQSWGLQMDIVAVPEVESWLAAALAGAFGAFWLNRQIWKGVKRPGDPE